MLRKRSLSYSKLISFLLVFSFPFISLGLSTRLAFNEWFIDFEYSKESFPKDRWGMSDNLRRELAKVGLRAVLSEEGLREFKEVRFPNGRKAFNRKEVKHMEDVNRVLSVVFPMTYMLSFLWVLGFLLVRERAKVLVMSGAFSLTLILSVSALVVSNYDLAFEVFHNFVFDPTSWRFRYTDTLLRIYPMKFWFDGTLFVILTSAIISLIFILLGFLGKRTGRVI